MRSLPKIKITSEVVDKLSDDLRTILCDEGVIARLNSWTKAPLAMSLEKLKKVKRAIQDETYVEPD